MRKATLIFLCICCFTVHCQITQLYTGTTVTIKHLSCIGNTVLIGGLSGNYLAKSDNEGKTLIPLSCPGNTINYSFIQRLDKDTIFLLSVGNNAELYRSVDGATNWLKRMDTTLFVPNSFGFFNSREGIADYGYGGFQIQTINAGASWTKTTAPLDEYVITKTYSDSIVMVGGTLGAYGGVFLSKNRGLTWPYSTPIGGTGGGVSDLCFLNKDTMFAISFQNVNGSSFLVNSTNGGQSWNSFPAPLVYNLGVTARKGNDLYVLGADTQNNGIIAKSTNLGQSWSQLNTEVLTHLHNLIFINDSIALLSGTNGVLLRWNYINAVFTGVKENEKLNDEITLFPNPVANRLSFDFSNDASENLKLTITNTLGQFVYSKGEVDLKKELDVTFLKSGIYYLKLESEKNNQVFKFIKE